MELSFHNMKLVPLGALVKRDRENGCPPETVSRRSPARSAAPIRQPRPANGIPEAVSTSEFTVAEAGSSAIISTARPTSSTGKLGSGRSVPSAYRAPPSVPRPASSSVAALPMSICPQVMP